VKQNIAGFGGNAHNVTIFGESAGGASVCDQVASPTAKGLFERGISVSGFYNFNVNTIWWPADCKSKLPTESQAQQMGATFAAAVGCSQASDVAACLREVPTPTPVQDAGRYLEPTRGGAIGPIANGTTLPTSAAQTFATGRENHVPLIIGVGEDEFNGGVYTNSPHHPVVANSAAQYRRLVRLQFGSFAPKVLRLYPVSRYPSPFIAYRTVMADAFSVCPALQTEAELARHIPTYAYQDDDGDSPAEVTGTPQPLGANHSAINRLVHDVPSTLDANQLVLQTQVLAEWTGFARDGNPSPAATPLWTRYSSAGRPVMTLLPAGESGLSPTATITSEHHCGYWDAVNRSAPWAGG
jgi:para-nitrobenzyl esterase